MFWFLFSPCNRLRLSDGRMSICPSFSSSFRRLTLTLFFCFLFFFFSWETRSASSGFICCSMRKEDPWLLRNLHMTTRVQNWSSYCRGGGGGVIDRWNAELFNGTLTMCVLGKIFGISTTADDSECQLFLMDKLLVWKCSYGIVFCHFWIWKLKIN